MTVQKEKCYHNPLVTAHNLLTDYVLPDGRKAYMAFQAIAIGEFRDKEIAATIQEALPSGSRIASITEIYGKYTLDELTELATSERVLHTKHRLIFLNLELVPEYMREIAEETCHA